MSDNNTYQHPGKAAGSALPAGYVLINSQRGRSYRIMKKLGSGGYGITYQALSMNENALVAVKELFPKASVYRKGDYTVWPIRDGDSFQKLLNSFLKEISVLCSLNGLESAVRIYDYFYANNTAYYVMEYVDGDDLLSFIEKNGCLQPAQWERQFFELMRDLSVLHQHGVIHRDISPDNIKLTRENRFKLIDFGSARSYMADESMTIAFKEAFAPIEQYSSTGQGAFTDVYTLAASMYYCFTGKRVPNAIKRQEGTVLVTPRSLGVNLDQRQEAALLKALAVKPADRFQSMEEFASAYFRPQSPPPPPPPPPPYLMQRLIDSWQTVKSESVLPIVSGVMFLLALVFQIAL